MNKIKDKIIKIKDITIKILKNMIIKFKIKMINIIQIKKIKNQQQLQNLKMIL